FPTRERALATGIFNAGTNVGAVLCPLGVLWIFDHWGWPAAFYITGVLGFFWIVAWKLLYDNPDKHSRLSASERSYITSDRHAVIEQKASVSWISLLGYPAVWAYLIAGFLAAPVWTIYMFFLPDFLDKQFHIPLKQIAWWTALFYFIATW